MKLRKLILWTVLIDFALFTGWAMWKVGYFGIWEAGFTSWGGLQILLDLSISCCVIATWLVADARARHINPWPWLVAILFTGSLATLAYLLVREYRTSTNIKSDLVPAV